MALYGISFLFITVVKVRSNLYLWIYQNLTIPYMEAYSIYTISIHANIFYHMLITDSIIEKLVKQHGKVAALLFACITLYVTR